MELPELVFERYECLEGTWSPMETLGENHFVGTVRHTVYSPGVYGYTTQVLKTIRLAVPQIHFAPGPAEVIEISSDSSLEEEEPDDIEEDPDYVPSEESLSAMSDDDSDDSGYTLSPALPLSPEYHPGPEEEDASENSIPVHAVGAVPTDPTVTAAVEDDEEEEDPEEIPEEEIIVISSSSDRGSDESVTIDSDPDL